MHIFQKYIYKKPDALLAHYTRALKGSYVELVFYDFCCRNSDNITFLLETESAS